MQKVHVMLVSEQAAPNMIAALDPQLKPTEAVLVVTQRMKNRANALQKVLQENGIKVTQVAVSDESNPSELQEILIGIASARDGQSIFLNLTGGTKLMALSAQVVAQTADWSVFYVDVSTDKVIWLDSETPSHTLEQKLRLKHYLDGYGYTFKDKPDRPQPNKAYQQLTQDLVANVMAYEKPIGQLNWLGQNAKNNSIKLDSQQLDSRGLDILLAKFSDAGILKLQKDVLTFASEDALRFATGGWLEYYVYQAVNNLTGKIGIKDKAINLEIVDSSTQNNEIDVAFLARNRLFAIECKTARMDNPESLKANDTLYKLAENCRRIGGLGTQGMLATYRELSPSELRLAKALNIKVVAGSSLYQLEDRIREWVNPPTQR